MSDSDVVIRVEGLGKKYALHHETSERYTALRDVVARQARTAGRLLNPFTLAGQLRKAKREAAAERDESEEEFWALKDVSFEIRPGERVGIIGRNGAGKSTLLKILSRITEPSTGRVEIRGRVASLLEVGTGFHPELTGRENIYLNGAILGMTRREIRSKFDEIVDFAEVEKFLDTPVKRYSSGMYVRLAFAVAAHLEPEILVVDEVLAVGDASFQKKCLSKMEDVAEQESRTILFVSHNMAAIKTLCNRVIMLKDGSIDCDSDVEAAIGIYISSISANTTTVNLSDLKNREGAGKARIMKLELIGENGELAKAFRIGQALTIETQFSTSEKRLTNLRYGVGINDINLYKPVTDLNTYYQSSNVYECKAGDHKFTISIKKLPLGPGEYILSCILTSGTEVLDWIKEAAILRVTEGDYFEQSKLPNASNYPLVWIDFDSSLKTLNNLQ